MNDSLSLTDVQLRKGLAADVDEALRYARSGRIEEWVQAYLMAEGRANARLSNGLRGAQPWWIGLVCVDIPVPVRVEGSESEMT